MRHALVTAGTKGLGKKVTETLLKKGYSVTANFRSDEKAAKALREEFSFASDRLQTIQGDITKKSDCLCLIDETVQAFGRIDLLIHNAGPYIFERKKLVDYTDEEWNEMMNGNLNAAFYLMRKTIPIMRKQQFGRMITYGFQSAGSAPGWMYRSAYAAAKVGLVSMTKTVALEEAENGITANVVCPGNIIGEMKESSIADSRREKDEKTPVGRSGTGEDIGRTIAFLCSDDSDMIT
ncbi:MAG TPA: SDR family oxidoreductase, partial [Bacillales bacterium]|nr:SDR family oxidoreductase [Bacillales bacterium]